MVYHQGLNERTWGFVGRLYNVEVYLRALLGDTLIQNLYYFAQ